MKELYSAMRALIILILIISIFSSPDENKDAVSLDPEIKECIHDHEECCKKIKL